MSCVENDRFLLRVMRFELAAVPPVFPALLAAVSVARPFHGLFS